MAKCTQPTDWVLAFIQYDLGEPVLDTYLVSVKVASKSKPW